MITTNYYTYQMAMNHRYASGVTPLGLWVRSVPLAIDGRTSILYRIDCSIIAIIKIVLHRKVTIFQWYQVTGRIKENSNYDHLSFVTRWDWSVLRCSFLKLFCVDVKMSLCVNQMMLSPLGIVTLLSYMQCYIIKCLI